jgi:hypothetical protein
MSRDVEVLREMLAEAEIERAGAASKFEIYSHSSDADSVRVAGNAEADGMRWHQRKGALSAAISALEEKEAGGAVAMCMVCRHPLKRYGCDVGACAVVPKSSSDSMEERIRALEWALAKCERALTGVPLFRLGAEHCAAMERARDAARTTLHPHQPWCRGDHSEGACAGEVDRGE